jgi:HNH endonuclease
MRLFPELRKSGGTKEHKGGAPMNTAAMPSALESETLARRLRELAGDERNVQADFLLHLDEFDRRRAYREAGYASLWDYCLRVLHLREGAAGRRIGAMRVLRRFPKLDSALRDGRLCLSTLSLLGQVLTEANLDELVAKAAYRTKAEVDHLVASLQNRPSPKDGVRRLPELGNAPLALAPRESSAPEVPSETHAAPAVPAESSVPAVEPMTEPTTPARRPAPPSAPASANDDRGAAAAEMRAVSHERWSLRVTIDAACKADLETLRTLLSHKTGADLAAVLHEAVRCGIEKHGKRRGAVAPQRERGVGTRSDAKPVEGDRYVPAAVRREIWQRDGGCCTWKGRDGARCGSRWKVEIDHIRSPLLGGSSTPENLRLLCRTHNLLHAEQVWGREHMALFRRSSPAISGDSERGAPA